MQSSDWKNRHWWILFFPACMLQALSTWILIRHSGMVEGHNTSIAISTLPIIVLLAGNRLIMMGTKYALITFGIHSKIRLEDQFLNALASYPAGKLDDPVWQNKIYVWATRVPSIPTEMVQAGITSISHMTSLIILITYSPHFTLNLLVGLFLLMVVEQLRIHKVSQLKWEYQKAHAEVHRKIAWFWDLFFRADSAAEIQLFNKVERLIQRSNKIRLTEAKQSLKFNRKIQFINVLYRGSGLSLIGLFILSRCESMASLAALSFGTWIVLIRCGQAIFAISSGIACWRESHPIWRGYKQFCEQATDLQKRKQYSESSNPQHTFIAQGVLFSYPGNNRLNLHFSGSAGMGDLITIQGTNGSGKSTILKLVSGILSPDQGSIEVKNRPIGYLMQGQSVDDEIHAALLKKPEDHAKRSELEELSKILNIEDILPFHPSEQTLMGASFTRQVEPSRGQWQKLSLYRAFYESKGLLLLDEPETALDRGTIEKLAEFISHHRKSYCTLIVTHHDYFKHISTQIWHLEQGKIQQIQR